MRVAIVSTFDVDGGAAKAAYRLHLALRTAGVESRMFVQVRSAGVEAVYGTTGGAGKLLARLRPYVDHWPARWIGGRLGDFSVNWLPSGIAQRLEEFDPNVVHLHGLHGGYVSLAEIAHIARPVVWTAHDMWPFTGGCHYDRSCERFVQDGCRPCPQTPKAPSLPLAWQRLRTKAKVRQLAAPLYVCPSQWLADVARRSAVIGNAEVRFIPNGLDLDRFRPIDKTTARSLFGLPDNKTVLLFGAMNATGDARKGYDLLDAALARLASTPMARDVMLCIYGSNRRGSAELHGLPVFHTGHLYDDESLVALYSAADIFVAPSRQDNLPNTVLEATACGLPTVAFAIGGMVDLVIDARTGWLAHEVSPDGLCDALMRGLATDEARAQASVAARALAEQRFSDTSAVQAYVYAYHKVIEHAAVAKP